ncbi:EAL domain-containing protein [Azospira restricta]|uniref:EAL domain-containing protein n=1 Tax=Azospira restricta TaxID=404405 RepID=A0A974Y4C3_9RHOO|nr:EAL domain-containing protein [Azospira restricta]QRJ64326.1 EAL domain-containing protein [Azospira restricta]
MPVAELIHYLNRENRKTYGPEVCPGDALAMAPAGVVAQHGGLLLRSVFQPLFSVRGRQVVGHEALLRAESADGEALTASDVFAQAASPQTLVFLDRLCRTLHALNYLQQAKGGGGLLFLNVEPRHVRAVGSGHGLVFETILKRCGLSPERIVFELRAGELAGDPAPLADALAAYRARGYRIAIDQAGPDLGGDLLAALRPELVKFDVRRLERWRGATPAATVAAEAAARARAAGAEVVATHVAAARQLALARAFAADFLQGHHFAPPAPLLRDDAGTPLALDAVTLAAIRE